MPVHERPDVPAPDNWHATIWRYMDFTKFVAMLERGALYFPDLAELTRADPFEGSSLPARFLKDESQLVNLQEARQGVRSFALEIRVNCWHLSENESAALWRLYLKSDEGIAIQSTCDRLRSVLASFPEEVHVGQVRYIDYENEEFPDTFRDCSDVTGQRAVRVR